MIRLTAFQLDTLVGLRNRYEGEPARLDSLAAPGLAGPLLVAFGDTEYLIELDGELMVPRGYEWVAYREAVAS